MADSELPVIRISTSGSGAKGDHVVDVIPVFKLDGVASCSYAPYADLLSGLKKTTGFEGEKDATKFLGLKGNSPADSCCFLGYGPADELDLEKIRKSAAVALARLNTEKAAAAIFHLDPLFAACADLGALSREDITRALAEGFLFSGYSFRKYKKPEKEERKPVIDLLFVCSDKELLPRLEAEIKSAANTTRCLTLACDWSNEPSNVGTPEYYAAEISRLAKETGLTCKVLNVQDAVEQRMGLFLGVGQGSSREGRIVVLEYNPAGIQNPKTVVFAGKGVTFDSGGLSIKPAGKMGDMKHDMTAAATMACATLLAALEKAPNRIVTILGFTENMPGGKALQPGSILKARSGKTVEVLNTDAEGRLVLADLLDYAHEFKPDVIVDAGTLTGAHPSLGDLYVPVMSNDQELVDLLVRNGKECGEPLWQLPLPDQYLSVVKSACADLRNITSGSGDPNEKPVVVGAGAIGAGMFLKQFIRPGTRWAHLDIGPVAYNYPHHSFLPRRGASGMMVRSLARFASIFK